MPTSSPTPPAFTDAYLAILPPALRDDSRVLTIKDVAQALNLNYRTVRGWIRAGQLPVVRITSTAVRIHPADLAACLHNLREREIPANPHRTGAAAAIVNA